MTDELPPLSDRIEEMAAVLSKADCTAVQQKQIALRPAFAARNVRSMERFRDEVCADACEDAQAAEHEMMLREQGASDGVVVHIGQRRSRR